MRVLFDCQLPAQLAHGGASIQIEQTKAAVERAGIQTDYLRWWDAGQRGDLIHFFGAAPNPYLDHARIARIPVVMTQLFTATCNRPVSRLKLDGMLVKTILSLPFGEGIKQQLAWRSYQNCSHCVVGLEAERNVLKWMFAVPEEKTSVVPLGLSKAYLAAGPGPRTETHLITTGTITERKNSVALAEMAHAAQVPILFVGKPYHSQEPYWVRFKNLIDNKWVKHHPHVESEAEMIALLREARGFVIMSNFENWCLSAHEAAACGLPLLVPDQNWSRERFGSAASYFADIGSTPGNIAALKKFHAAAPTMPAPAVKLYSWDEVARELATVYQKVAGRMSK